MNKFGFSYRQEAYDELLEGTRRLIKWKQKEVLHEFLCCDVSVIGMKDNVRVVVRRRISGTSSYIHSDYTVNLMMGFVAKSFDEPKENDGVWEIKFDTIPNNDKDLREIHDVKIWSENKEELQIFYEMLKNNQNIMPEESNVFLTNYEQNDKLIPVIYQPVIDSWKNFLREIHVRELPDKFNYEVTLIFNDESLREHFIVDVFYRFLRLFRYKRTKDIETFFIHVEKDKNYFTFPNIYSDCNTIYHDTIHGDKYRPYPKHEVKYYFQNKSHPIIFINTSNHSMAEHDNNHDFWKWEYIPWSKKMPIFLGNKSRKTIDEKYK